MENTNTTITQNIQALDAQLDTFLDSDITVDFTNWQNRVNAFLKNDAVVRSVIVVLTLCKWFMYTCETAIESGETVRGWLDAWWTNGGDEFTFQVLETAIVGSVNIAVVTIDAPNAVLNAAAEAVMWVESLATREWVTADWWSAEQVTEVAEHPRHDEIQAWLPGFIQKYRK